MSDMLFQWVMPIGSLSVPTSYENVVKLIRSGRVFPTQLVSLNQAPPIPAFQHDALKEFWLEQVPPERAFDGEMGRVNTLILCKLFAYFATERLSGRFFVRHSESGLYFTLRIVSGQVLEVSAMDPSTYLGQMLLQKQLVAPSQLVEVIDRAKEDNSPIGTVAIKLGYLNEKLLNQLLAEQMFNRIRKIACFPHLDVRFVEDKQAAFIPPVARISGYSLLEITLGYGFSDQQIKQYMSELLLRPVIVNRQAPALKMISAEDRSVLKQVYNTQSLDPLKNRNDWTQRDSALKAITWDLINLFEVPKSYVFTREYNNLSEEDVLSYLQINQAASPHEIERLLQEYRKKIKLDEASDTAEEEHVRRAIRAKLVEIQKSLEGSDRERRAYQRMKQLGANPQNQEMYRSVLFDICTQEGEAALKRQKYQEAAEAYAEALRLRPNDLNASLQEVWAEFLSDSRNQDVFEKAKHRLESLSTQAKDSPLPFLVLARIYRLKGEVKLAEEHLRKVLDISPNHKEAQAELRLLFNRDYDKKKHRVKSFIQLDPNMSKWLMPSALSLVITVIFWASGNLVTHPRDIWPEERPLDVSALAGLNPFQKELTFNSILRTNYSNDSLASTAYLLGLKPHRQAKALIVPGQGRPTAYTVDNLEGETMRELTRILSFLYANFQKTPGQVTDMLKNSLVIPAHLRVLGNVEHYWLQEDWFGWARRLTLILLGIFGLYNLRPLELKTDFAFSMSATAIIYGGLVGYLSPAFTAPTELPILSSMKIIHSLGEVMFFQFFLGVALLRGFRWTPYLPATIVVLLFALFKISYLNIWYMPLNAMLINSLQIGVFIGGACFLFMWKSKSFIPPLLAHLALTFIPLLRGLN